MSADAEPALITIRRLAMLERGWKPIPVSGKRPFLDGWQNVDADAAAVRSWEIERYKESNTGALTKHTACVDVDIRDAGAVEAILDLLRQRYGAGGKILVRVGSAPKAAVPFKTGVPFKKKFIQFWPPGEPRPADKDLQRIEILADGQQFVVDGVHPDTRKPYTWSGGEPWNVARDELPPMNGDEAAALLAAACELLIARGWNVVESGKGKTEPKEGGKTEPKEGGKGRTEPSRDDSEWRKLNNAAMANLSAWVPALFPSARPYNGGYRISSADLGRDLEEDLSIVPEGIKDFGVHDMGDEKEGKRTPLDLIMEYGNKDLAEAPTWLRERLGIKDGKQFIKVAKGRIASTVDQAEVALIAAGVPLLIRAGSLVHPIVDTFPAARGHKTQATVLRAVGTENIVYLLNKFAAVFLRFDEQKKKLVAIDPPSNIARSLLYKGEWAFPKVSGVITTPTLRTDGTILDRPGYDPATQLWYAPDSYTIMPPLKAQPTREDAEEALQLYEKLLVNFPFVTNMDSRWHWLPSSRRSCAARST